MRYLNMPRFLAAVLTAAAAAAHAGVGMAELPPNAVSGLVTVFYPSQADPGTVRRGDFRLDVAIDRLAREPAFARSPDFALVGMFGMSEGGHTALTLAGGRWSPSRLREHCRLNIAEDFHGCAGPSLALTGGLLDGVKKLIVSAVNDRKFDDSSWYEHVDGRIIVVVVGVPFAADFDPDSLRQPRVALALIGARKDRWLIPRFHGDAIAAACRTCEQLVALETGGHGALLGPLPPGGGVSDLIQDPPVFDRVTQVPRIKMAITGFFQRTLAQSAR
jgi:hypothetical protein